jgi:Tfp pilus assembly protein FimT
MRRLLVVALAVVALLAMSAAPVAAAPPQGVSITVDAGPFPSSSMFFASGPAVESGLICATGRSTDLLDGASIGDVGRFLVIKVNKEFDCGDGDTFVLRLKVRADADGSVFTWKVIDGTGA